jgi:hypothetical protein
VFGKRSSGIPWNFHQDTQRPDGDSNETVLKYKSELLLPQNTSSVSLNVIVHVPN